MLNVIIFVGFVAILGIFLGLYLRRRAMVFEGVVTDKDIRETTVQSTQQRTPGTISLGNTNQAGIKHDYLIKVQSTSGKIITWEISQGKYEIVKIGDHVTKAKGTTDIQITPQVSQNPVPTPPPASPSV